MRSQCGPLSSLAFTAFPTSRLTWFDSQTFRVLLLRRLHLPLSLSARACQCGRPLDAFGHHRSACATSGVLGRRGFPLESAAARVCREAGPGVRTNVMVRDLDPLPRDRVDNRRLEVVADGLSLHGGAQLAIDTTLVSPLARDGSVKRGADRTDGAVLGRKERTYPELAGVGGRATLVVLAAEVGGRWSQEFRQFLLSLASAKALSAPYLLQSKAKAGWFHRWSCLLGCTAAKSFAVSLLDGSAARVGGSYPLRLCMMCSVSVGMRLVSRCT